MLGSEAQEQIKIFQWASLFSWKYPELDLMYHVPNGGSRNPMEAANLKRQGVKSGVPDICLPSPKGVYHGLYIELKAGKNKTTDNQKKWLEDLEKQGYKTIVCYGFDHAMEEIIRYLEGKK